MKKNIVTITVFIVVMLAIALAYHKYAYLEFDKLNEIHQAQLDKEGNRNLPTPQDIIDYSNKYAAPYKK